MFSDKLFVVFFVLLNVFVRYLLSVHQYSGAGKSPMYGDYEAQRHWMEITTNLPVHEWYFNSTNNDLMYWGLDYPPLTAYHSWLVGSIARQVEPASMQLFDSRGYETSTSKIYMRMSVILSDLCTYLPAVFIFVKRHSSHNSDWSKIKALFFLSLQPALLLIDHGHFQYNGVSLGLALASFLSLFDGYYILASAFFCLSLNFKQMGLYYSTTIFFYLLGVSFNKTSMKESIVNIGKLGFIVLFTFGVCWIPFLKDTKLAAQVLHRIFPLARGLFEDKVANFWCAVSPFIKFKNLFPQEKLLLLSLACTVLSLLPSGLTVLFRPKKHTFIFALIAASLGYFLFSFQVHEKSILLPLLPVSMLVTSKTYCFFSSWFLQIAIFSMYPLLYKDGLIVPYIVAMVAVAVFTLTTTYGTKSNTNEAFYKRISFIISLLGMCIIHLCDSVITPPQKLPDIFVLLFAMYSFIHFFVGLIYANYLTIRWRDSQIVI